MCVFVQIIIFKKQLNYIYTYNLCGGKGGVIAVAVSITKDKSFVDSNFFCTIAFFPPCPKLYLRINRNNITSYGRWIWTQSTIIIYSCNCCIRTISLIKGIPVTNRLGKINSFPFLYNKLARCAQNPPYLI